MDHGVTHPTEGESARVKKVHTPCVHNYTSLGSFVCNKYSYNDDVYKIKYVMLKVPNPSADPYDDDATASVACQLHAPMSTCNISKNELITTLNQRCFEEIIEIIGFASVNC